VEPPAFLADQYKVAYWEETASDTLDSGGPVGAWGTTAVSSPSGCRTSTATRTARALLGRVLFRHTLRAQWCWAARRVTQVGLSCLITDVDSVAIKADLCASSGYYYSWNGAATGGYHAIGSATYSNCIFRYGCWRQWVVNVELWLNGNGTWTSRTA
jgi:hypothetical protein